MAHCGKSTRVCPGHKPDSSLCPGHTRVPFPQWAILNACYCWCPGGRQRIFQCHIMWLLWSGSVWSMRISLVGQLSSLLLAIIIIIMEGPSWGCTSFAPVWPTRIRLVGRVTSIVLLPPLPLVPLKHQIGGPGVGPSENMDNLLDIKAQWPVIIIVVLKAIQEDFHDQQWTVNNSCPVWLRWPQGSSKGLMLQKKGANMLE